MEAAAAPAAMGARAGVGADDRAGKGKLMEWVVYSCGVVVEASLLSYKALGGRRVVLKTC